MKTAPGLMDGSHNSNTALRKLACPRFTCSDLPPAMLAFQ